MSHRGTGADVDPRDEISPEEEAQIRAQARRRLLAAEEMARASEEARQLERQRRTEAERLRWRVVEEETEKFYRERGRVRYVSSSGHVLWLTPEDIRLRRARRVRGRKRGRAGRAARPSSALLSAVRTAGVSLAAALGLVLVLAAVIYVVEFV